ncbi:MAG: hypothetical protein ACYSUX_13890 [Planctomycetota bacterium]|jgi:uncharacterized membrane protein
MAMPVGRGLRPKGSISGRVLLIALPNGTIETTIIAPIGRIIWPWFTGPPQKGAEPTKKSGRRSDQIPEIAYTEINCDVSETRPMPEITLLGWIHTIIAVIALIAGFYTLAIYKVITPEHKTGQLYLTCTLITAVTALMIYKHGGFGPGHSLAVLTLLALLGGFVVTKIRVFAQIAEYFQAFCYSATLLFHMIPAITDGLLRLPPGDPVLSNPQDPILKKFYLAFLVIFLVGYAIQFQWLKKQYKT